MKRHVGVLSLMLLLVTVSMAADNNLTGKWSGNLIVTSADGEKKDDGIFLVLKENGTDLTGTAGPNQEQQFPIQKGKIEGTKLIFEVQSPKFLINFDLTLTDGHLKGEAKIEHEGETRKAVVDLQKLK
jgi:hypothetical protein